MSPRAEAQRVLEHVRELIRASGISQRRLEERLGFSRGYLSQLLGGTVEIKMWQFLSLLESLDIEPSRLFGELFPKRQKPEKIEKVRREGNRPPLSLELAHLYGLGIESIDDLATRLERCENVLDELHAQGFLESWNA